MGIFFFKTPRHRVFEYKPLYYDPRKEALEEKIENERKREAGEYVPGDHIRRGFGKMKFDSRRSSGPSRLIRFITVITIATIFIALYYFTDVFQFFWNI